jgi:methylenetetrahydrofolate dehydrogenase (NADP+)/methenyltetrahydrofolate cyclohydrolase
MAATLIDGRALAQRIRATVAEEVRALGEIGLATVLVGDDPASDIYIRLKHKAASEAGIRTEDIRLPADTSEDELVAKVEPLKDADGLHPLNTGELFLGRPRLVGATPIGILALLNEYRIELDGAHAVVIGRSDIVGKPVAHLLLQANATVTICHSHTRDLASHTLEADVLVAAAGRPGLVTPDMVKARSVVIDVGMNRTDAGVVGDVDPGAEEVAAYITPVPGGVGPMTIACLLQNAVRCARYRRGELAYPHA